MLYACRKNMFVVKIPKYRSSSRNECNRTTMIMKCENAWMQQWWLSIAVPFFSLALQRCLFIIRWMSTRCRLTNGRLWTQQVFWCCCSNWLDKHTWICWAMCSSLPVTVDEFPSKVVTCEMTSRAMKHKQINIIAYVKTVQVSMFKVCVSSFKSD